MLDQLTPEEWREWEAYHLLNLDPLDRIAEILKMGFAGMLSAWCGKEIPAEAFEPPSAMTSPVVLSTAQQIGIIESAGGNVVRGDW